MLLNTKEILDTQESNQFISMLKDIAPNQLKIDQANGCIEATRKGRKTSLQSA